MPKQREKQKNTIPIHSHELPLSCPTEKMELWNAHPKVYLPIERTGKETCPYCGTHFVLIND